MKKLLYILLLWPVLLIGQTETSYPYIDLSKYHDGNRLWEMTDSNFISLEKIFSINDSSISDLKYIDYKLTDGWSMQEGRSGWNDEDKTLEIGLDQGSVLQIGQEIHVRATNKSGVDITDGAVVYVDSAQGNRPTIMLASDTSVYALLTLGVATQDIDDNDIGYVTIVGLVRGYDTRGFDPGDVLWLGTTPGSLVNVRPSAPNTAVTLGVALNSTEDGIIAVRPVVVQRLSWLSDVAARGTQTTNDMLVWDDSMWIARDSIATDAITYTDTYWDDLRVPLSNTQLNPAQSEPDFEDTGDGVFAWGFDTGNDSIESLHFIAQLPHLYKEGTDIDCHIHWFPNTTNTGDVVWKVFWKIASINDTFSAVDSFRTVEAAGGVVFGHQLTDIGDIDGTGIDISAVIMGNITRLGTATDDTYTGTVYGLEIDFHYQIDAPGSETEMVKY